MVGAADPICFIAIITPAKQYGRFALAVAALLRHAGGEWGCFSSVNALGLFSHNQSSIARLNGKPLRSPAHMPQFPREASRRVCVQQRESTTEFR